MVPTKGEEEWQENWKGYVSLLTPRYQDAVHRYSHIDQEVVSNTDDGTIWSLHTDLSGGIIKAVAGPDFGWHQALSKEKTIEWANNMDVALAMISV